MNPLALLAAAASGFLGSLQDVPVPDGFAEVGEAITFDAPEGRILAASAVGAADAAAIAAFYDESLPQLGWRRTPDGAMSFARGDEALSIAVAETRDGRSAVRYVLVARPGQTPGL